MIHSLYRVNDRRYNKESLPSMFRNASPYSVRLQAVLLRMQKPLFPIIVDSTCRHPLLFLDLHRGSLLSLRPALADRLVPTSVSRAVGEEVVDDHATNREEEDEQAPQDLVCHRAS